MAGKAPKSDFSFIRLSTVYVISFCDCCLGFCSVYSYSHCKNSSQAIHLAAGIEMDRNKYDPEQLQWLSGRVLVLQITDHTFCPGILNIFFVFFSWELRTHAMINDKKLLTFT